MSPDRDTIPAEGPLHGARRAKIAAAESDDETEPENVEADAGDNKGIASGSTEEEGGGDNTDLDANVKHAEEAYRATKIMGDTDRKVSLNSCSIIRAHTNEQLVCIVTWRA